MLRKKYPISLYKNMKATLITSVAHKATQIRSIAKFGMNKKKSTMIGQIRRNLIRTAKKEIAPMING